MGHWVDAHSEEALLQVRVPVVLNLVVSAPGEVAGNCGPPVAQQGVQVDDRLLLFGGESAALDVRPQVIRPPQSAALATPRQT